MRVLILGLGSALLGPIVAASLRRAGAIVILGHAVGVPPLRSRHYDEHLSHPPFEKAEAFQRFMLDYARAHSDVVLFPGQDAAMMAIQPIRGELDRLMPVAAPPPEATARALDKAETIEAVAAFDGGIRAPPTIYPTSADDAVARWHGPWPVIIKPRTGSGTVGVRMARDPDELRDAYALVEDEHEAPLVQMLVQHDEFFGLHYLFDASGQLRSWFSQRTTTIQQAVGVGASSARTKGGQTLLWQSHYVPDLLEQGRRLMEALGWQGFGVIQLAYDERDGKPYIFEINPRIPGTLALSLKSGLDFPNDACLVAMKRQPPERLRFEDGRLGKKDPFSLIASRRPGPMLSILDPRRTGSALGITDPLPILQFGWRVLKAKLQAGTR